MRLALSAFALLVACSSEAPPVVPLDAAPDTAADSGPEVAPPADVPAIDAAPDVGADAAPEAAMDAGPEAGTPDATPDQASPPDAGADAASDVAPDRFNCGEGVPPACSDHGPCAVCLPTGTGAAWCCRSGFCRPAPDRSTCD